MKQIILLPNFNLTKEHVLQLAVDSKLKEERIDLCIPIIGELYFTDSQELASQFLTIAYIGQNIYSACAEIESYLPSSIEAHESAGFELIPKDPNFFVEKLWEVLPPFMSDELKEEFSIDDIAAAEVGSEGWGLLDLPESNVFFPEIVEHAKEILERFSHLDDE